MPPKASRVRATHGFRTVRNRSASDAETRVAPTPCLSPWLSPTDRRNIADLIVAKHRNGPTASIPLRFFPGQIRFADLEIYRAPEP